MKPLAILVGLALLAAASCSSRPSAPKPLTIQITHPENPMFLVSGQKDPAGDTQLVTLLTKYRQGLKAGAKPAVAIQADPQGPYESTARVILACGRAKIEDFTLDGQPVHLPSEVGPVAGKATIMEVRLRVKLFDVAANGENNPAGTNDHCMIVVEDQELGEDFQALHDLLAAKHEAGLDSKIPIHLSPTLGCRHHFVMEAYDAAQKARFTNIEFGFPDLEFDMHHAKKRKPGEVPDYVKTDTFDREPSVNEFLARTGSDMPQLEVIGVGGGGHNIPEFAGPGNSKGFFGVGGGENGPRKIVYVIDRSGSMTDSIDFVKYELKRSVSDLTEKDEFHVIFYTSGPPVEMPARRLVLATDRNKQLLFEFVDNIVASGETDPSRSLERAFACQPAVIYILTDGEFDHSVADLIKRLNPDKKVTVHTIAFLWRMEGNILQQIAADNGGQYKYVSEKDLENLGK
jgi:biopolymer transport protein ExbD